MNQEKILYRITQLLSRFKEQVEILNANGEFSINSHAEDILVKLLSSIYDYNLENVNHIEGNTYPSIDLRDKERKIAIQVTATNKLSKITSTLEKFIEKDIYKEYPTLYVYILTEKKTKYDQEKINRVVKGLFTFSVDNIIDRADIYKELRKNNDVEKISTVCKLLEKQFADNTEELSKWDLYCKGMSDYDVYICNLYRYLDMRGYSPKIDITRVKIEFEEVFVDLWLDFNNDIEGNHDNSRDYIYNLEDAVNRYSKIVVLGDPGSGKSTILKYLAYKICAYRKEESQYDDLVPLLIKGSEYAKCVESKSISLKEYIVDNLDKKYEMLFTQKLEKNQLLILFDGIDEIYKVNQRHAVVDRINGFIAQYPKIKIVVTSRIVGYNETRLSGYFNHSTIMGFDPRQIRQFILKWLSSLTSNFNKDYENARRGSEALYSAIQANSSVWNMASNPLLTTILILIYYQGGALPERRVNLYEIATSTLLESWVRKREISKKSDLGKDVIIALLAPISHIIHQNYRTWLIPEHELKPLLNKVYRDNYPNHNPRGEASDLDDIINFLKEDAGFFVEKGISENGDPLFGFVHKTFQEYFTAIEVYNRWLKGSLMTSMGDYVLDSSWNEVVKLAASLIMSKAKSGQVRRSTTEFIRAILDVNDQFPSLHRPLKLSFSILIDETEVEYTILDEMFGKVLNEILIYKKSDSSKNSEDNREVSSFRLLVGRLIQTKMYQSYIIDRISKVLHDSNYSVIVKENLVSILMDMSAIDSVSKIMIEVLNSDNPELKSLLFSYPRIAPTCHIACTKEFRDAIIKFVNSSDYIRSYDGHLPTQYYYTFIPIPADFYIKDASKESENHNEEELLSIKLLSDDKMRFDYINYIVFSVGEKKVDELKEFVTILKKEYEGINLERIESHIIQMERFDSYSINKYPLFKYMSTNLYLKNSGFPNFAFLRDGEVEYILYPFTAPQLQKYFFENTESYLKFLNIIIPAFYQKSEIIINDIETLIVYIEYEPTIYLSSIRDQSSIVSFAFDVLTSTTKKNGRMIYNWINKMISRGLFRYKPPKDFDKEKFISELNTSEFEIHEKLLLLKLVGDKSDYAYLVAPTIQSLSTADSEDKKKEINDVLYKVV